ncbi:isochorismatase family protein [Aquipuribacter nitratireducens]|uniref:Isochorismatase family protein n=1 Tax=Aquipuribacter nitratireducens TaxID=650104 RepID=A0ABW0GSM4_9MICO
MTPDLSAHQGTHDRSGWGGTLRPGRRTALLCIDMVRAYYDEGGTFQLPSLEPLRSAARLLEAARSAGVLVAHSGVRYAAGGLDGGPFVRKVPGLLDFVGDTAAGQFRPEVAPRDDEVVLLKQMPSAFFGTTLASTLTAAGVDTVVVCGVSTSGCVRATVVDAMSHGFTPFVVADACGDRSADVHSANLRDLAAKYAEVVDEAWALEHLRGRSPG